MIVHISKDEKFIDMAMYMFNKVYKENKLLLCSLDVAKFVKSEHTKLRVDEINTWLEENSSKIKGVVIHSLFTNSIRFPKNVKVLWIGFGFDYYDYFGPRQNLLLKKTRALKYSGAPNLRIKDWLRYIKWSYSRYFGEKARTLKRIDFFSPVLFSEFKALNFNGMKYLNWNYGDLDNFLVRDTNKEILLSEKNKILVGNSATYTNNHLDLVEMLKSFPIGSEFVIPLSYGDMAYKEKVVRVYKEELSEYKLNFLNKFMPATDYFSILSGCDSIIMGHLRQQGYGNIITSLYMGLKVILLKDSILYKELINKGYRIFSEKDLINSTIELSDIEKKSNRELLIENWSENIMIKKTNTLVKELLM